MSNPNYYEQLKDPRWQRKRLEIMQRAEFRCEECLSNEKTLHVHHGRYIKGAAPWEYGNGELHCLCEDCHATRHLFTHRIKLMLAPLPSESLDAIATCIEVISGLAAGLDPFHAVSTIFDDDAFNWPGLIPLAEAINQANNLLKLQQETEGGALCEAD